MHGKYCPERTFFKSHLVLDFTKLEMLHRHDNDIAVEITRTRCQIRREELSKIQPRLPPRRNYSLRLSNQAPAASVTHEMHLALSFPIMRCFLQSKAQN